MFHKRIAIVTVVVLTFAASFISGYFTMQKLTNRNIEITNKENEQKKQGNIPAQTAISKDMVSPSAVDLVTTKTKVIIRYNYLVDNSNVAHKDAEDKSYIDSIVGMNEESVKKFFEDRKFKLVSFSSENIIVSADIINSWPPNAYVVKSDDDKMFILVYETDSQGKLTNPRNTDIKLDMLPTEDKNDVVKGKVFFNYEEVEGLLDDYTS